MKQQGHTREEDQSTRTVPNQVGLFTQSPADRELLMCALQTRKQLELHGNQRASSDPTHYQMNTGTIK